MLEGKYPNITRKDRASLRELKNSAREAQAAMRAITFACETNPRLATLAEPHVQRVTLAAKLIVQQLQPQD